MLQTYNVTVKNAHLKKVKNPKPIAIGVGKTELVLYTVEQKKIYAPNA